MLSVVALLGFLGVCSAHLCLLEPHQRGSMADPLTPANPDCHLRTAPCGGRDADAKPSASYQKGTNVAVTWQKNFSHYNQKNPGIMEVSLIRDAVPFEVIQTVKVNDDHLNKQQNYTKNLMIPDNYHGHHGIVQVVYKTNSLDATGTLYTFYSCADITIT
ncbi:Hypothetical predicted protein [Mytilus galloprovincialis]|uniref:Copper acquisition factor BIM1-like domain-containing protein n=1 Tax=Mytilus galloprovincialis TaxID=29158 RepID=A0A8B6CAW5_MYTGA|nr:Hypothetical predicted protein [Mytilus galloprovincialis]